MRAYQKVTATAYIKQKKRQKRCKREQKKAGIGFGEILDDEMKEATDAKESVDDGGIPVGQPGYIGYPAGISRQWANTDFYVKGDKRW